MYDLYELQVTIVSLPAYPLPEPGLEITVVPTYVDAHGLIYAQPLDWEGKCVHQSSELQRIYGQVCFCCGFIKEPQIIKIFMRFSTSLRCFGNIYVLNISKRNVHWFSH